MNQKTCGVSGREAAFLTVEGKKRLGGIHVLSQGREMISCGRLGARVCLKDGGEVVEGKALEC